MEGMYEDVRPALVSNGLGIYSGFCHEGKLYVDNEVLRHYLDDLVATSARKWGLENRARFDPDEDGVLRAYSGGVLVGVAAAHEAAGRVGYCGLGEPFGLPDEAFATTRDDGHLAQVDWSKVPEGVVLGSIGTGCAPLASEVAREAEMEIACKVGDSVGRELDMIAGSAGANDAALDRDEVEKLLSYDTRVSRETYEGVGRALGIADTAALRAARLLAALGYGTFLQDEEPNDAQVIGGIDPGQDDREDPPAPAHGGR